MWAREFKPYTNSCYYLIIFVINIRVTVLHLESYLFKDSIFLS